MDKNSSEIKCKCLVLLFIVLFFNQNGFAQFKQGNYYLGLDYARYDIYLEKYEKGIKEEVNRRGYIISSVIGGFVSNNVAMGFLLSYEPFNERFYSDLRNYKRVNKLYSFNPFIKSHVKIYNKMAVFVYTGINVGAGKFEEEGIFKIGTNNYSPIYEAVGKAEVLEIGVQPGLIFLLTKKLALESRFGFIGYQYLANQYEDRYSSSFDQVEKKFTANFSKRTFRLGLSYYFNK